MRNVWTIARREYSRFFSTPIAYIISFVILLTLGLIFFLVILGAYNSALGGGFGGGTSAPGINWLGSTFSFLLMLCIPALTMRLMADENRMGTMELLLTAPIRDWELIVGKWLAGFLFVLTLLAVTLVYPFILNSLVTPGIDQRLMMASYLSVILFSAAFIALGVGMSSVFNNPTAAFFATLGLFIFLWWLVGFPASYLQNSGAVDLFNYLSTSTHLDTINRGTINLAELSYFLSLTALGLFTGAVSVEVRRWG